MSNAGAAMRFPKARVLTTVLLLALPLPAAAQDAAPPTSDDPTAAAVESGLIRPATPAPLAATALLLGADRAGDRLVTVGQYGHILLSDDNGASWRQVPSPADSMLTAVDFVDGTHGWAVGHDSVVLATTDGGESWTLQYADPELEQPLMDVLFTDRMNGIAVGAYGMFLETSDGGKTWTERQILEEDGVGYDFHYNAVRAPAPDLRFIAGEAGTLAVSTDSGATWTLMESPYDGSYFDALALDAQTWLIYGLQGNIFRTEDAGKTWTPIDSGTTAGIMGGADLGDGKVVLVGLRGVVLTSNDGGRSFTLTQRGDRVALSDAISAPDGSLILLGETGALPPIK